MLPVISGIHKVVIFIVKRNPVLLFGKKTGTTVVIENSLGEPRTEFIMICTLRISLDPSRYVFIA